VEDAGFLLEFLESEEKGNDIRQRGPGEKEKKGAQAKIGGG